MRHSCTILLLCIALILLLPANKSLAESADFEYSLNPDDSIRILRYLGKDKKIVVPSEIEGKTVSIIGESAFAGQNKISKITLPKSITSIESKAFEGCSSLTTINLHQAVKSIAKDAFAGCDSLLPKVYPESYAHKYFVSRDLPYQYFKKNNSENNLQIKSEDLAPPSLEPFQSEIVFSSAEDVVLQEDAKENSNP